MLALVLATVCSLQDGGTYVYDDAVNSDTSQRWNTSSLSYEWQAHVVTYKSRGMHTVMRQHPTMHASEQVEAAWDCEVGVPPGVRTDSKTGSSSHTGLATWKLRVGAHARAPLRPAV
jgi:hypothetical protein